MSYHSFDPDDAKKYGIEKAIILCNLRFWLDKELANVDKKHESSGPKIHEHKGIKYVWTYNSSKAYQIQFPYMKAKSISRWLRELEEAGAIISGIFNKSAYDKTKWYSMPEYSIAQNEPSVAQNDPSMAHDGQSTAQNEQPIPDINTYSISDVNTYIHNNDKKIGQKIIKSSQVQKVFDTWVQSTGRSKRTVLDDKRKRLITAALKNYSVDELILAVTGWEHSPWHRGENPSKLKYNDLGLLLRDSGKIESFIAFHANNKEKNEDIQQFLDQMAKRQEIEKRAARKLEANA